VKQKYGLKLFVAVIAAVLLISVSVRADEKDKTIEFRVKNSYMFKKYLKDDNIATQSKNGVVTLKGNIKEESHKILAQETVANIPGVKKVDNQLVFTGKRLAENSDECLIMKVKIALLFHRSVNASKAVVEVKDRVVTLKGEAVSRAQKNITGEYAKDVIGVKDVKNEIQVVKSVNIADQNIGEQIDDASVTAQITAALLSHRSTITIYAIVSTNNGAVTLSGTVKNNEEKSLVGRLAEDINGVKSVLNNMTISDKPEIHKSDMEYNACGNETTDKNSCNIK
jgi:osmotically-inducible protein OsmY